MNIYIIAYKMISFALKINKKNVKKKLIPNFEINAIFGL